MACLNVAVTILARRLAVYFLFYRAMHFSAKRGLACRLSVCPSVTLVDCDHIGWNSSEIISQLVSLGCSLSAHQTSGVYSKENTPTPKNFGTKWPTPCWFECRRHSIANCGRMVTDSASVTKWGFHMPQDTRMAISPQWVFQYTSCLVLG